MHMSTPCLQSLNHMQLNNAGRITSPEYTRTRLGYCSMLELCIICCLILSNVYIDTKIHVLQNIWKDNRHSKIGRKGFDACKKNSSFLKYLGSFLRLLSLPLVLLWKRFAKKNKYNYFINNNWHVTCIK